MHTPVLLNEVLQFLGPKPGEFMIDGTMDGGGHAAAILDRVGPQGKVLGIDWDRGMVERAGVRFAEKKNMRCVAGNYADLPQILESAKLPKADGLLLDLGFSSEQLESSGRGFSFLRDEPMLMTYDPAMPPVKQLLRELSEPDLAKIIFEFGGERFSRRIAKAVKERGRKRAIETSGELAEIVRGALPKGYERGRIDPATRTFQALRIYANRELENLERALANLPKVLAPGGRAVVISFHSLEDKIVKIGFKIMEKEGTIRIITKKPAVASREEMMSNPRSRSAKLRTAIIS
ncbi:MAG TPA: 16S rRNA (cytosine(1402)-N(4))-methyltransferase RsmH [Candidatus Paceibacterota bacterium]|nr:16S rRNA (cytosine(1402)-N(4))-methyltransferase RsmH [Candidatus Paceibacterota bacterium]